MASIPSEIPSRRDVRSETPIVAISLSVEKRPTQPFQHRMLRLLSQGDPASVDTVRAFRLVYARVHRPDTIASLTFGAPLCHLSSDPTADGSIDTFIDAPISTSAMER